MSQRTREAIRAKLTYLYGPDRGQQVYARLAERLDAFAARIGPPSASQTGRLTERDMVLITYGNQMW